MFEWQEQYLTSEREWAQLTREILFLPIEHKIHISERVMFFLSYKHTRDFPKISGLFPKIYKDFPKLYQRPDERSQIFPENYFSTFLHVPSLFIYCNICHS